MNSLKEVITGFVNLVKTYDAVFNPKGKQKICFLKFKMNLSVISGLGVKNMGERNWPLHFFFNVISSFLISFFYLFEH